MRQILQARPCRPVHAYITVSRACTKYVYIQRVYTCNLGQGNLVSCVLPQIGRLGLSQGKREQESNRMAIILKRYSYGVEIFKETDGTVYRREAEERSLRKREYN